jgi:two-component system, NarL family, sensor histidine kinase LiaS
MILKKRFTRPFRRLQGKLALSYTLTMVSTLLLFVVVGVGLALFISSLNAPYFFARILPQETLQAPPYFVHGSPDREALASWLQITDKNLPTKQGPFTFPYPLFLSVVDTQGHTIASVGSQPVPSDTLLQAQLSPQDRADLHALLQHIHGTTNIANAEADGRLVAISAIVGPKGTIEGALIMKIVAPDKFELFAEFLPFIGLLTVILTTIATIIGIISGYLAARGFTQRLQGLSVVANRWSHGDFSATIHDSSEDELGQTSFQLNHMAEQLQHLLQARQKLATLEERNRLARDLHDSVKQQIFAISMQVGATKFLLRRDVDGAEVRLNETEKLVRQAQQELTSLIRELRPVALEGKGLVAALRELATQWAQQTNIVANLSADDIQPLPLTIEEALFRIAQEALANVARHSKATLVQMILTTVDDTVTLSIIDNGQGFDTTQQGYLGVGLHSMQERMKAFGGDVQIESSPEKGTRIIASCNRLGTVVKP